MESIKVLFISQEITPYLAETKLSRIGRYLPQGIQELGKEIRTFMPRYGCINERRNQLHEVIRLSGMNLIIDDTDHPLIIKVASIQSARMQVYFIDNEDYFQWMTALVPVYLRNIYVDDPLFHNYKIIYSVYNNDFINPFRTTFADKLRYDGIDGDTLKIVKKPDFVNVSKLAIKYSDGIIIGSEDINKELKKYIDSAGKPVLPFQDESKYIEAYNDFYDKILS